jgi:tRNA threonylcarbamoyladenosine biosynthesis protein TsaB
VILGLDTATPSTAVAVWAPGGPEAERRDDPAPGTRPGHASRLLPLVEEALAAAGASWDDIERIACGIGPGGFTGLRLGIATARALAQARDLPLVGVSSLLALREGVRPLSADALRKSESNPLEGSDPSRAARAVAAVIDARRGEVFAAVWDGDAAVLEPAAIAPEDLAARLPAGTLAVGDGAVRFRPELERAGASVPADDSPAHRVSALVVCRLGATGAPADRDALLPDYRREPDAKPPRLSPP